MRKNSYPDYEDRFCKFSNSVEKGMSMILVILIIFLFLSQVFLSFDDLRILIDTTEKLEGSIATF